MATAAGLMTVEEFQKLGNPPGAYYELRHGEAVAVTRPKLRHSETQERLRELLKGSAGQLGKVRIEFAFRPLPEHELWVADVAYVRSERWPDEDDDYFTGAPDLVIEVLSPSNTAEEIEEKKTLCLKTGALEFWVLSGKQRTVTAYAAGTYRVYRPGESVPVDRFFPGQPAIPVDEIFSDSGK
jgi:Uma2 family endonuclease